MLDYDYKAQGHARSYGSPEKQESRKFIADCWREFSRLTSIQRQYWTLCGPMAHRGALKPSSELAQLTADGLFSPNQFVGVECKRSTWEANQRAVGKGPTLIHGDIVETLNAWQARGELAADIVNLDTVHKPPAAVKLLTRTLNVLNHVDGPTMVAWNVITRTYVPRMEVYPWDVNDPIGDCVALRGYTVDLLANRGFRAAFCHGWDMFPAGAPKYRAFRYEGTRRGTNTLMTTYVFVRRKSACGERCTCLG